MLRLKLKDRARHFWRKYSWPQRILFSLILACIAYGIYLRLDNFRFPYQFIFDEKWYVDNANFFIRRVHNVHDHPALGKLFVALGILAIGDNTLGWRIASEAAGILCIILVGVLAAKLFRNRLTGWLAAAFVSLDGLFITYSRTAHIDIFLIMLVSGSVLTTLSLSNPILLVLLAGGLAGLAAAVKFHGAWVVFALIIILIHRKRTHLIIPTLIWGILVYAGVAVAGEIIMKSPHPFETAWSWQKFAWNYHTTTMFGHTYGSYWYYWPLERVPVQFYRYDPSPETTRRIITLANPFLLWSSTLVAAAGTIVLFSKNKLATHRRTITIILGAYLGYLLPWVFFIKRTTFFYHYFPAYLFLLLGLAGFLIILNKYLFTTLFLLTSLMMAWFFSPIWTGAEIAKTDFSKRVWLESWEDTSGYNWPYQLPVPR